LKPRSRAKGPTRRWTASPWRLFCPRRPARLLAIVAALTACPALSIIAAEGDTGSAPPPRVWYVESGADFTHFSRDYGNGNDQFLVVSVSREWSYLLRFDFGRSARFGESGLGGGASITGYLERRWSFQFGANTGSGRFILPRYRLNASIGRAFLPGGSLSTEIGYVHDQSKGDNYFDRLAVSATWYARPHWMLGGYFNYDIGQPGSTRTKSGGAGLTWYDWRERYVGTAVEYGDVNYVQVGPANYLVSLRETLVKVYYTEYFNPKVGLNLRLDVGTNDFYNLAGISVSLFKEW
jgi:YaiO family outer membrane protein